MDPEFLAFLKVAKNSLNVTLKMDKNELKSQQIYLLLEPKIFHILLIAKRVNKSQKYLIFLKNLKILK